MATDASAQLGWSSLPVDLVNRVADCLLATNDLDYYMDLRAVCHGWRSSTADPKNSHDDPRYRPDRWIMLHPRLRQRHHRSLPPPEAAAPRRLPHHLLHHRRLPCAGGQGTPTRRERPQPLHGFLVSFQGTHAFRVSGSMFLCTALRSAVSPSQGVLMGLHHRGR